MQATKPLRAWPPWRHAFLAAGLTLACFLPSALAGADRVANQAASAETNLEASVSSPATKSETAGSPPSGGAISGTPSSSTNLPPVSVKVLSEGGPGIVAQRAYVSAGADKFAFLVPFGFRLGPGQDTRTVLHSDDYSSVLTFRMVDPLIVGGRELGPALGRQLVLREHPNAVLVQDFSLSAANRAGPAFDFHWLESGLLKYGRTVFIPWQDYVLEFALSSDSDQFVANQRLLNTLLLTFRAADAAGKLDIAPLSDKL